MVAQVLRAASVNFAAAALRAIVSAKKDTVNTALREVAARNTRQRALERLMQLGDAAAGYQAWRERKGLGPQGDATE